MKRLLTAAALVALMHGPAAAAVPEIDSPEGHLACAGLVGLGFYGATASKPPVMEVVAPVGIAYGFYLGRVHQANPAASKKDIDQALAKLTLAEKNTLANACMKRASALLGPVLTDR